MRDTKPTAPTTPSKFTKRREENHGGVTAGESHPIVAPNRPLTNVWDALGGSVQFGNDRNVEAIDELLPNLGPHSVAVHQADFVSSLLRPNRTGEKIPANFSNINRHLEERTASHQSSSFFTSAFTESRYGPWPDGGTRPSKMRRPKTSCAKPWCIRSECFGRGPWCHRPSGTAAACCTGCRPVAFDSYSAVPMKRTCSWATEPSARQWLGIRWMNTDEDYRKLRMMAALGNPVVPDV